MTLLRCCYAATMLQPNLGMLLRFDDFTSGLPVRLLACLPTHLVDIACPLHWAVAASFYHKLTFTTLRCHTVTMGYDVTTHLQYNS